MMNTITSVSQYAPSTYPASRPFHPVSVTDTAYPNIIKKPVSLITLTDLVAGDYGLTSFYHGLVSFFTSYNTRIDNMLRLNDRFGEAGKNGLVSFTGKNMDNAKFLAKTLGRISATSTGRKLFEAIGKRLLTNSASGAARTGLVFNLDAETFGTNSHKTFLDPAKNVIGFNCNMKDTLQRYIPSESNIPNYPNDKSSRVKGVVAAVYHELAHAFHRAGGHSPGETNWSPREALGYRENKVLGGKDFVNEPYSENKLREDLVKLTDVGYGYVYGDDPEIMAFYLESPPKNSARMENMKGKTSDDEKLLPSLRE